MMPVAMKITCCCSNSSSSSSSCCNPLLPRQYSYSNGGLRIQASAHHYDTRTNRRSHVSSSARYGLEPRHESICLTHMCTTSRTRQSRGLDTLRAMGETDGADTTPTFPRSSAEIVKQAYKACQAAWKDGISRQRIEIILPLIGATDLDDWPGGIRQQFKAAQPMVEDLLTQMKNLPGLEGPLSGKIIDDADAVGAWTGDTLGLVLFPTAETVGELRKIAEARKNGLVIIANPQWTTSGQVISDFGVLPWVRKPAMELVKSFQDVYIVKQLRINGDDTRWMYTYPYGWQIFVVRGPREMTTILTTDTQPSYNEVENALRALPWTMSSKGLLDRIQAEAEFNRRSLESLPPNE